MVKVSIRHRGRSQVQVFCGLHVTFGYSFLLMTHWRSQKPAWLLLAGAMVGLSLLFVIDTGIYLALTFLVYNSIWIYNCRRLKSPPGSESVTKNAAGPASQTSILPCLLLSLASAIMGGIVLFLGLYEASGATVFSPGYIRQWMEVLWLYPSGISMLPMIEYPLGMVWSYWFHSAVCGAYLRGYLAFFVSAVRQIRSSPNNLCLYIGAIPISIYYIGRSHPYLIFQLTGAILHSSCVDIGKAVQRRPRPASTETEAGE